MEQDRRFRNKSMHLWVPYFLQSEVAQSCLTLCDPMDCGLQGSSIHGILQARILEWVAISFSRGSSQPGSPALEADTLMSEPPGKPRSKPLFWLSALYLNLSSFLHFISRIIKYVFFCVQLLSPSIMPWDSFMLLPVAEVLCFFQFLCDIPLHEYNTIYPFYW